MKITLVCILLVMLFCDSEQQFGPKMGPYDIIINRITNCAPEEAGMLNFDARTYFAKLDDKKTQLFGADISYPFSKEDYETMLLHNDFYQRKNNDYLLMYKFDGEMCKSMEDYGKKAAMSFWAKIGLESEKFECYIPPGNYSMDNWEPPLDLPTPVLEYGSYKVKVQLFLGTRVVGCIEAYGDIKPKGT